MPTLDQVLDAAEKRLERLPQEVFVQMSDLYVLGTPRDTGSARASWLPSKGDPQGRNVERTDGAAYPQRATVQAVARSIGIGDTASLGNAQPYMLRLEYEAWSAQAPGGWTRTAIAQLQVIADNAARRLT